MSMDPDEWENAQRRFWAARRSGTPFTWNPMRMKQPRDAGAFTRLLVNWHQMGQRNSRQALLFLRTPLAVVVVGVVGAGATYHQRLENARLQAERDALEEARAQEAAARQREIIAAQRRQAEEAARMRETVEEQYRVNRELNQQLREMNQSWFSSVKKYFWG